MVETFKRIIGMISTALKKVGDYLIRKIANIKHSSDSSIISEEPIEVLAFDPSNLVAPSLDKEDEELNNMTEIYSTSLVVSEANSNPRVQSLNKIRLSPDPKQAIQQIQAIIEQNNKIKMELEKRYVEISQLNPKNTSIKDEVIALGKTAAGTIADVVTFVLMILFSVSSPTGWLLAGFAVWIENKARLGMGMNSTYGYAVQSDIVMAAAKHFNIFTKANQAYYQFMIKNIEASIKSCYEAIDKLSKQGNLQSAKNESFSGDIYFPELVIWW